MRLPFSCEGSHSVSQLANQGWRTKVNERQAKKATLHDVAKSAGVSYQTVSRVINNSPHVSPRTLRRVQKAINELHYQPNRAARILNTGRSNSLEVVFFGIDL